MITPLIVHNYYRHPGGEDQVFENECTLLEKHGHRVVRFAVHSSDFAKWSNFRLAANAVWNRAVCKQLSGIITREQPDIVHFHNTFPNISPAAYWTAQRHKLPVVQTLHNYRMFCPAALLLRRGRVCELCLRLPLAWPGIVYSCYRDSKPNSAALAAMLFAHRLARTFATKVDRYIALTSFSRQKFIEAGLAGRKVVVKPNFVFEAPKASQGKGAYALFVGRLSAEKGLDVLLDAWSGLMERVPLKIVGDGPLAEHVAKRAGRMANVQYLGRRPHAEAIDIMANAGMLIVPSVWFEGFPMTVVEAFSIGLPVVASRLGSLAEIVHHERTGILFNAGDAMDLAACVRRLWTHPKELLHMRAQARQEFDQRYSPEPNYRMLVDIYGEAIESKKKHRKS
jgi:glycosyltransferase involved in cell wall biosynthesis